MECSLAPRNKLNIFVSSAQRNEGDFEWGEIRERVVKNLRKCPYLNPFIMEESVSEFPSTQRFLYKVEQSDLVILLVKGVVREGTAKEIATAMTKKKPMLVYFLEDENPSYTVEELKQDLRAIDYCTFRKINSIDHVEDQILQEVIENVIDHYQYTHYSASKQLDQKEKPAELSVEQRTINTPTKETFALFESAYNYVFDCLSMGYLKTDKPQQESALHSFGTNALEWLINGANWPEAKDVVELAKRAESIFGENDWYLRRWDAIKNALLGRYEEALTDETDALDKAKKTGAPTWVIINILIDCRNLINAIDNEKRQYTIESFAQKELNESETIAFLPVADRFLENMYKDMLEAEMERELSSPFTVHYGSNLSYVVKDCVNSFFSAILYGSYTHIILSRETLANVLYKYAQIIDYPELLLRAINLHILSGNAKSLKQILDNKWDVCYSGITSGADRVWSLTDRTIENQKIQIKQAVFCKLGMYFSDKTFDNALSFFKDQLPKIYWGNCEDYLQSLLDNIVLIAPETVIEILNDILANKKFNTGRKITDILLRVKFESIPYGLLVPLHDALLVSLPDIMDRNGSPQMIAALVKQRPEIFSDLVEIPNNGLVGGERLYYDLNMGGQNYDSLYENLIKIAHDQFVRNSGGNGFSSFAVQPYSSISSLMMKGNQMSKTAEESFFALCKEVFSSTVPIPVKDDCCDCLCDVLLMRHSRKESIPSELIDYIPMLEDPKDGGFFFEGSNTKNTFLCRTLLLKILLGIAAEDEIVRWSIMLGKVDINERVVIAKCAKKYLQFLSVDAKEPNGILFAVALQCIEDDYHTVRQYGCDCLCYLLKTRYRDIAETKLYEMALDSSHWVRNHIVSLCKNGRVVEVVRDKLLEILKEDANFGVSRFASFA
jgi:hypothetical protein